MKHSPFLTALPVTVSIHVTGRITLGSGSASAEPLLVPEGSGWTPVSQRSRCFERSTALLGGETLSCFDIFLSETKNQDEEGILEPV
ncbi:hypothetical protein DPEC_G00203830 [Dallia pectoralis]|uniref:Uncharacterized protein n=1 Tax=Dallia pectoralis TaxID=75939 RepID=A0ACC2G9T0_DALPE|nr:hypothetical protein DPEC_G00203830 [Dallia pectoralis]